MGNLNTRVYNAIDGLSASESEKSDKENKRKPKKNKTAPPYLKVHNPDRPRIWFSIVTPDREQYNVVEGGFAYTLPATVSLTRDNVTLMDIITFALRDMDIPLHPDNITHMSFNDAPLEFDMPLKWVPCTNMRDCIVLHVQQKHSHGHDHVLL